MSHDAQPSHVSKALNLSTCPFLIRWRHPVLLVKLQQQQKYYFPGVRQNLDNNEDKIIFSQIIDKIETRPSKSLLLPTCHATHLKLILVYQISKKCLLWKSTWIIWCVIEIRKIFLWILNKRLHPSQVCWEHLPDLTCSSVRWFLQSPTCPFLYKRHW